jgi:hypothetical protein
VVIDPSVSQRSIENLKAIYADEPVLVLISHDLGTLDVIPFFPNGTLNEWYQCDWKRKLGWRFLDELLVEVRKG